MNTTQTQTQTEPQEHQFHNSNTSHTSYFTSPNIDYHITSPPTHLGFSTPFSLSKNTITTPHSTTNTYTTHITHLNTSLAELGSFQIHLLLLPLIHTKFWPKQPKRKIWEEKRRREIRRLGIDVLPLISPINQAQEWIWLCVCWFSWGREKKRKGEEEKERRERRECWEMREPEIE